MILARVTGTVVSTQKHRKLEGAKLLLVQPLNADDTPRGYAGISPSLETNVWMKRN